MGRFILISLLFIYGCSAQYHENKFYKKGGTFKCEPVTDTFYDTIINDVGDTLIIRSDTTIFKPVISYVPKYVYKYLYKTIKSVEKQETKQTNIKANANVKNNKQSERTKRAVTRNENRLKRLFPWIGWLIALFMLLIYYITKRK